MKTKAYQTARTLSFFIFLFTLSLYSTAQNWTQVGLDVDGEATSDFSGQSVSMNAAGDRMAIGAPNNDGNGNSAGHVRVYEWNGTAWNQMGVDIDGEAVGDQLGYSVSMNGVGDRLAIGAKWNNGNGSQAGHVRVYEWNGTAWIQLGIDIDGEAAGDQSGFSVSMNSAGDRLAIGAYQNDGNGFNSGHVRVYEWNGTAWIQLGLDIDGEAAGDFSGYSVSINAAGNRVAIGARNNVGNVSAAGHVRIYEWSGINWIQLGADIDGEALGDFFGYSVSMNTAGNRVAIGAPSNDGNGSNSGHVRIYDWNGTAWVQMGVDIDGEAQIDASGYFVSMNGTGDRVAIGAVGNAGNGNSSGHVRVYEWNGTNWVQLGTDIDGEVADDRSGWSVSMNAAGDRLAIGAPYNDGNGSSSGHVRVYQLAPPCLIVNTNQITNATCPTCTDGTATATPSGGTAPYTYNWSTSATTSSISGLAPGTYYVTITDASPCSIVDTIEVSFDWQQVGIDLDGEAAGDRSGTSVSMNNAGNRMAIGAPYNDGNGGNAGHVRIYEWNGTAWMQMGADLDGEASNDNSGKSVSMNGAGNRVAIGADGNNGNGVGAGHVRIYEWNGVAWTQMGLDIDGEAAGDRSGNSISINAVGDRLAIGAGENDGNGGRSGHVRIYEWNGTVWTQVGMDIDGEDGFDRSGFSVSINAVGDRLAIGADANNDNGGYHGHVRVYSWNGTAWVQLGADIDGEAGGDQSGHSVSMNSTGDRIAIGAILNDGNGSNSGHVRVYEWNGTGWIQLGVDIDGEAANDLFGFSVSINAAGDRLAVGGRDNGGNGSYAGHVRLYEWNGMAWSQLGADIDGEAAGSNSGASVSMNATGDRLAIGANVNNGNGNFAGHVRVYQLAPPCLIVNTIQITNASCPTCTDGAASATLSGGIAPYTYNWSTSATTSSISGLAPGTYYVTISDAGLCSIVDTVDVNFEWPQMGNDIDGEAPGNLFGYAVSMPDSNTIAIGAPRNSDNGNSSGHVRIYERIGSTWLQKGLDIDGEAASDESGWSVSMPDASTVAIGAYRNDGNGGNSGHVRIYKWSGTAWIQKGLDIDGEAAGDWSSQTVSMPDSNTIAIGAQLNDGIGSNAGHVRIYEWNGNTWIQKGVDIDGESAEDRSGSSVSMPDANTIAIGAGSNDGNGNGSGHVRIYKWSGSSWIQFGADIDGEAMSDGSGYSVNMPDSNTVAIGAPFNDGNGGNAGHVRVYAWNGTGWAQMGADIDGEAAGDRCGWSVSMPDANTVAIGAAANDGNGSQSGHVRIFKWNGTAWIQLGMDIDGEASGDWSGNSISMPNSDFIAIGGRTNDGNGGDAGHVRIFALTVTPVPSNLQLRPNSCGITGVDPSTFTLYYDLRSDATDYRVRVNGPGVNNVVHVSGNDNRFNVNEIAGVTFGQTYTVEVAALINGEWSGYGISCTFSTESFSAVDLSLRPAYCGIIDIDPSNTNLFYDTRTDASNYRVRVNGSGVNNVVHVSGNDNRFNVNQIAGVTFGQTYTVEVAAFIAGQWSAYGTSCSFSTESLANAVNLSLRPAYCGIIDIDPSNTNLFYYTRTDATDYRVRVNGAGVNNVVHVSGNDNRFNVNQIAGVTFGQTYTVEVAAFIAGQWSSYGTSCSFSTESIANAVNLSLRPAYCGIIDIDPASTNLFYYTRTDATDYRVRVNGPGVNNVVHVSGNDNRFNVNQIAGVTFGQTYTVEVAAFIAGQWSGYGTSCSFSTESLANAVNLSLRPISCGAINIAPTNTDLFYFTRTDATDYRVRVNGPGVSNVVLVSGNDNRFNINQIAGVQFSQTYTVEVAAFIGGVWSNYGTVCNVSTSAFTPAPPMARMKSPTIESVESISEMSVYPNPSAQDVVHIKYNRNSDQSTERIELEVFDISGKKIIKRSLSLVDGELMYDINTTRSMSAGIYIVRLVDGKMTKTEKLIIR